ncbi:hypothetical protein ACFLRF_03745 [Candidatus Altiarchaeota archaeon]
MDKGICRTCGMRKACRDSKTSWIFFLIGIIATIALRIIEPLKSIDPLYAKLSWYVGVAGFLLFFIYKYRIQAERSRLINSMKLKEKLESRTSLSDDEYGLLRSIVCSQDNWKERVNYLAIFVFSGLALIVALFLDLAV